jgi:hypothetical protein
MGIIKIAAKRHFVDKARENALKVRHDATAERGHEK